MKVAVWGEVMGGGGSGSGNEEWIGKANNGR